MSREVPCAEGPAALIFDVFGTLTDWRTSIAREVAAAFAAKGRQVDGCAIADAWRAEYQPAMARVRHGARGYVPLDILHRENLERVLAAEGAAGALAPAEVAALARAWERLDSWPDVGGGLARLRRRFLLAPCSNGSIAMMARLARHAGWHWDAVLGAEIARDYKPKPAVYRAAATALGLQPGAVMMVAAHNDDLRAARDAGLATAFFARPREHGPGQSRDLAPEGPWDAAAQDIDDLARGLGC
ncbi:haloacid dehalogenase type II [soil metagenome]